MSKNEKPIHVFIPSELYRNFRIKLFKEGKTIKEKIVELIERYVKE
jgi:predicted HTH domain antitoxin